MPPNVMDIGLLQIHTMTDENAIKRRKRKKQMHDLIYGGIPLFTFQKTEIAERKWMWTCDSKRQFINISLDNVFYLTRSHKYHGMGTGGHRESIVKESDISFFVNAINHMASLKPEEGKKEHTHTHSQNQIRKLWQLKYNFRWNQGKLDRWTDWIGVFKSKPKVNAKKEKYWVRLTREKVITNHLNFHGVEHFWNGLIGLETIQRFTIINDKTHCVAGNQNVSTLSSQSNNCISFICSLSTPPSSIYAA